MSLFQYLQTNLQSANIGLKTQTFYRVCNSGCHSLAVAIACWHFLGS